MQDATVMESVSNLLTFSAFKVITAMPVAHLPIQENIAAHLVINVQLEALKKQAVRLESTSLHLFKVAAFPVLNGIIVIPLECAELLSVLLVNSVLREQRHPRTARSVLIIQNRA